MKPLKYRNVPTIVDGRRFASKREAKRYSELRLMEKAGEIQGLECQPRFPLVVNDILVCSYVGDFMYWKKDALLGPVVEDVKGVRTDVYKLKKRLLYAVNGIDVKEV